MKIDFWKQPNANGGTNREHYKDCKPEEVHTYKNPNSPYNGRQIAWDVGNKRYRILLDDGSWFDDSVNPKELIIRKKMSYQALVLAYRSEVNKGGSLESLIRSLEYYKNNLAALRTQISNVNGHAREAIAAANKGISSEKAKELFDKMGLTALKSKYRLTGQVNRSSEKPSLEEFWKTLQS